MRSHLLVVFSAAVALAGCQRPAGAPAGANAAGPVAAAANTAAASPANAAAASEAAVVDPGTSNPATAAAAGPSTVTIHFQRGANCWKYMGAAATFNGKFAAGQRLDITSTGEAANGDGAKTWFETRPRSVDIAGAGGQLLSADNDGYFTIPATGLYQITFDPMAMVGAPGVMIVCTL
jgi:hypothetical protein